MFEPPQMVPAPQTSPGQQGWPAPPQVPQVPPAHTVEAAVQLPPAQQV